MLISWKFKHLVRPDRSKRFNAVIILCGYSEIEIHSPQDLIYYGTE